MRLAIAIAAAVAGVASLDLPGDALSIRVEPTPTPGGVAIIILNRGEAEVRLASATSTCDCVRVARTKRIERLRPGESARVEAVIDKTKRSSASPSVLLGLEIPERIEILVPLAGE